MPAFECQAVLILQILGFLRYPQAKKLSLSGPSVRYYRHNPNYYLLATIFVSRFGNEMIDRLIGIRVARRAVCLKFLCRQTRGEAESSQFRREKAAAVASVTVITASKETQLHARWWKHVGTEADCRSFDGSSFARWF